jgi:hypothetical protein
LHTIHTHLYKLEVSLFFNFGCLFYILVKLLDVITLFTLILLRPLGGVFFGVLVCLISITMFYPLSIFDKKG